MGTTPDTRRRRLGGTVSRWATAAAALVLAALCLDGPTPGTAPRASAAAATEQASSHGGKDDGYVKVRPILDAHCVKCHSGEKPKGDLRLDNLGTDFADRATRDRWLAVAERVAAGEMPPKAKLRPPQEDVRAVAEWARGRAAAAAAAQRAAEGRVVLRRLNRVEYENTVRDLLGVDVDLKDRLPEDTPAHGFDNVGDALHTSSFLMERYLDAADTALSLAVANAPKPPPLIKLRYLLKDQHGVQRATERVYGRREDALVMFSSSDWNAVSLSQFYPPDRGRYRVRISAYGFQSGGGKPVTFRVDAGPMLMGTKNHLVGYYDAAADEPTVVEFVDRLEARSSIRLHPYGLATAHVVNPIGADNYKGPGLAVQWIEVEGPLHDQWPPESHRRIFGDLERAPPPGPNRRDRVEVVSKDAEADADAILRRFAGRAFRREVTDADVKPYADLVRRKLGEGRSFEQAVRAGLLAVMVSPDFLFLRETPVSSSGGGDGRRLDDFAIASRLSYFLWSTMPDEELLAAAGRRELGRPDVLRRQVERMLGHPKASAFVENFVGQWLGLRDIDFTVPSHTLYPEYDEMLKASMPREAELFFAELLKDDLSVTNFVASDFSVLNGRLAKHYGIPDVTGWSFRKVVLPPDSHRGGVLTMAGVLKVTANGTSTSPVTRGAWVLDRILGTPPPRPPPDVPAVEPDIRGATTIREQLAKHRQLDACAGCHSRIDPPGFALESFDVIGGWRDRYRATGGRGKAVVIDGRRMPYQEGPPVDPADVLPDGRRFANVNELKQLLLADKDQVARALTVKLLTYATGGPPEAADAVAVDAIVAKARDRDYGLRSLVHEIVQSPLFRTK